MKNDGTIADVLWVNLNSEAIALKGSAFRSRPLAVDVTLSHIVLADYTTTTTTLAHSTDAASRFNEAGALIVDLGNGASLTVLDSSIELKGLKVPTQFTTTLATDVNVSSGFVRTNLPLSYDDVALPHTDTRTSRGTAWEVKKALFNALTLHASVRQHRSSGDRGSVQMEYAGDIIGETSAGQLVVQSVVTGADAKALSAAVPRKLPVVEGTTSLACGTSGTAGFICLAQAVAL